MKRLLNELISMWWKPRGKEWKMEFSFMLWWWDSWVYELNFLWWEYPIKIPIKKSIRELCSLESWLWQFVCENGLIKNPDKYWKRYKELTISDNLVYLSWYYQYRLIESALCDEDKLEDFILDNIVIKDE